MIKQKRIGQVLAVCVAVIGLAAAPDDSTAGVHAWRTQHEPQILHELFDLLAIPNVATDKADIQRNADALVKMFERRQFTGGVVPTAGSPLVLMERRVPGASRTLTFYFHYDGQPVDASEWTYEPPFSPVIVAAHPPAGRTISLDTWQGPIDPEWRIYGRSSSDDKSPIVALPAAIDALDAQGPSAIASNVRILLEGEEEAGSPNLAAAVREHADRIRGDALILVDGPRHASGRVTMNFGARGLMAATITVYGALRDLHSGNYGNWAPNPALDLARLLASMKDEHGRVTIDGFYDDVVLTASERQAVDEIPNVEPTLPIVRLPTLGGSTPFYLFADVLKMPTFGLQIVNFDNNQHGANENLRIENLWEGTRASPFVPLQFLAQDLEVAAR